MTLAAVAVATLIGRRSVGSAAAGVGIAVAMAVTVWGGTVACFAWRAGADAVLRDGRLLLFGLPPETRRFLYDFSGIAAWRQGLATLLYSASLWFALLLAVPALASSGAGTRAGRRRLLLLGVPAAALLLAWAGGASVAARSSAPRPSSP